MTDDARALLEQYPPGTRIRLTAMPNDPNPVPAGTCGTITGADDWPSLYVRWDNARTLKVLPGIDQFTVLDHE